MPLPTIVFRDCTLEFEIRVERTLIDLKECLREAVMYKDCHRELVDTLKEDIEEMNSAHKSKLATLRVELNRRGQPL